jgi:hypothetical protein
MKIATTLRTSTLALLLAAAGCRSLPADPDPNAPPPGRVPLACAQGYVQRSELLRLARTEAPADGSAGKRGDQRLANTLAVDKNLQRAAHVTDFDNGWSSFALRISSEGAHSISVHLADLELPRGTEVWLCSADGSTRQGPYREAVGGNLWTPVVPGSEAWLEVLVQTAHRRELKATVAEVYGGFQ